jgi:hypothetical protein
MAARDASTECGRRDLVDRIVSLRDGSFTLVFVRSGAASCDDRGGVRVTAAAAIAEDTFATYSFL